MPPHTTTPLAALRKFTGHPPVSGADAELLQNFCADRDEAAFTALVRRHGRLVLDVCRTVLRNDADAEDAFQASFVALAGAAHRVRRPAALAGWLHAVAWRTAGKARRARDRRRAREARVPVRPDAPAPDPSWAEVRQAIHEEVARLPDRYRTAIVLFHLAGRTQDEVARALGLSTAGAKKRLERGRALLRSVLDIRGFGPTVALATAAITLPSPAPALASAAANLAIRFVTSPGDVPTAVLSLLSGGVRPMIIKSVFGATVLLGVVTTVGLGVLPGGSQGQPTPSSDTSPVAQAKLPEEPAKLAAPGDDPRPGKGDAPPRKAPPPGRPDTVLDRFRALDPADRLTLVERLAGDDVPFTAAKRDDLVASIVERGSIEPANAADLVCKVKARDKDRTAATTIKWLIDDGRMVKKGDRLALLDDAGIREQFQVAILKAKEAEAAKVQAAEHVRLVQQEGDVEVRLAEIDVKLADIELKDPPKGTAKEVLALKVEQAKLKVERARFRMKAQLVQAEAEMGAKTAAGELAIQRQRDVQNDLIHCELVAPSDGMVVYHVPAAGRFGGAAALIAPGEPVREGQTLLRVVDLSKLGITTRVPEAQIATVRVGQTAQVRVDAFSGKVLKGKVTSVSPVASVTDWQRADVKVYPVTVAIEDAPPGLKPSMTGDVQIATDERKGVVQVPLKAVVSAGRDRLCFVKSGKEIIERKIVPGASNASIVEIKEGLKEGEMVVTDPTTLLGRP